MVISIICVYNDEKTLNQYLLKSLKKQNEDYELILVDNRENEFSCAADALNYGGQKAQGELLFFVHQDVEFYENNFRDILNYCKEVDNLGIAGVVGVSEENNGRSRGNIYHGVPPRKVSEKNIYHIEYAQTLDELLLIIPKNVFNNYKFDSYTCYHWHLYGADYCLNIKKEGYDVVILPIGLYHASKALSMSLEYFQTLKNILNKYNDDYDVIYTTCLLSHNPKNQYKLNIFYLLEKLHIRMPLMNFFSHLNFLKKFFK